MTETLVILVGIYIVLAIGGWINFAIGEFSVGQAAFMAIGAYTSSILTLRYDVPLLMALPVAGLLVGMIAFLLGYLVLRIKGIYLVIATLGLIEIVQVIFRNSEFFGGLQGLNGMTGITVPIVVVTVIIVTLVCYLIYYKSSLGLAIDAIRDDELVAETMGYPTAYLKSLFFGIGGAVCGISGVLYAHFMYHIEPLSFGLDKSFQAILFVFVGGGQTFWGAIVGSIILVSLPEQLRFLGIWRNAIYGVTLVVVMILRPQGLITKDSLKTLGNYLRRRGSRGRVASPDGIGEQG